ncbi:MAG TPA: isoprenylcysteine carboxylmethyltransferase family protein [Alphaproteobacteria bacterium]
MISPQDGMWLAWGSWAMSWAAAAAWSDRATAGRGGREALIYYVPIVGGAVLMFGFGFDRFVPAALTWRIGAEAAWAMVALAVAGFLFAWWARLHLGRLWSSGVTRKEAHRVVDTGPYALVRHPIYTGLYVALAATALLRGTAPAALGAAAMAFGWYVKARIEERFLRQELGAEAYDAYARRVPMLVPFLRL